MKLHLPVILRRAVLAFCAVTACTLYSGNLAAAADITLTDADSLTIDYAEQDSITDLEGGTLQLMGDTPLLLSNCGEGDGRVYTLFSGISQLTDKEGNILLAGSYSAADYFDTTLPGTGFWAGATLQLTSDGTLQLVLHNETVKAALTVTTHQTAPVDYSYYKGVAFNDVSYSGKGGAIGGGVTAPSR